MWEVDLDKFWKDDEAAHRDNCFFKGSQVALGIRMSDECVFAELGEEGTPWAPIPRERRLELNKRYNDKAEKIVGRRLLSETLPDPRSEFPYVKRIGEVFGGSYIYENDTEWLTQSVETPEELAKLLDRVERMDIRSFMLPDNWESEKRRIYEEFGLRPGLMRHVRGPVTLACSIFGSENLIFLGYDEPELFERFSRVITDVILKMAAVMDEEAGVTADSCRGFSFADDNCCLLTPDLYRAFGYPVLKSVFAHYSPDPDDKRYQHSDSAMAHLLPILGELDLNGVNFGPTVMVPEIRKYLPHARIDGCIAPFTFMRNEEDRLTEETLRDIRYGKEFGGVNINTAGSINNGSLLSSMRQIMSLIQREGM
ncbi:MAG: uroporphyrinogen decarboxylase family protein [Candidatus Fimadaptatus sp.]|jgi:uroporphyrinogen decarboxylase